MKYNLFILPFLFSHFLNAQVYNGNIMLATQGAVDSFPINYPGISHINGELLISSNDTTNYSNISYLDSLYSLQYVTSLYIGINASLTNCKGLDSLKKVDGLYVYYNPSLKNFHGLEQLKEAYSVVILKNDSIPNLSGLSGISILSGMTVSRCKELTSLSGLDSLKMVDNILTISENPRLKSITGLNAFERGGIVAEYNDSLLHFGHFPSMWRGAVSAYYNPNLLDFEGFNDLEIFKMNVNVIGNPKFQSFKGLEKVKTVVIDVANNATLKEVKGFDSMKDGAIRISGPAIEIIEFPSVTGNITHFEVFECPRLKTLSNYLPQVDSCNGYHQIHHNDSLVTVHEDFGPKYIAGLEIELNPRLEYVTGFEGWEKARFLDSIPCNYNRHIYIQSQSLREVSGFNHLNHVSMHIDRSSFTDPPPNFPMEKIEGFNGLEWCDCQIYLEAFPQKIIGFNNLEKIRSVLDFYVRDTISAFQSLDTIGYNNATGRLKIAKLSTCITDPATFSQLKQVRKAHLDNGTYYGLPFRFPMLERVDEPLGTSENDTVTNFLNLYPMLNRVGQLYSINNSKVTTMDGFEGINLFKSTGLFPSFSEVKYINLWDNESLTDCSAICHLMDNATFATMPFNPTAKLELINTPFPCDTEENLMAWCDTLTIATNEPPISKTSQNKLSIHPNPSNGEYLSINMEGNENTNYLVSVSDMSGRIVLAGGIDLVDGNGKLNVSALPNGTYNLSLRKGERVESVTFFRL